MVYAICMLILLIIAALILFLPKSQEVDYAFAGAPCGSASKEKMKISRYRTISKVGNHRIDISKYKLFIAKGHSLELLGIPNGSYLYAQDKATDDIDITNLNSLKKVIGHFIILMIDINRTRTEHPNKQLDIEKGFKARKAVDIFPARLNRQEFNKVMNRLLAEDTICNNKEEMLEESWDKYSFASQYYQKSSHLIVSITFRQGEKEGYSFHSPNTLFGVVKYKNRNVA